MPKRKPQQPPRRATPDSPKLYLLDQFSAVDLENWNNRSKDVDELILRLYLDTEPDRVRYSKEIQQALSECSTEPFIFENWFRVVTFKWTNEPLSCAGSLTYVGGRFNVGVDVEHAISGPFPALYLAQDFETAYREKYQLKRSDSNGGLSSRELSLEGSHTAVRIRGHIERVLDVRDLSRLRPFLNVIKRIKRPATILPLMRRLKIKPDGIVMVNTMGRLERSLTGNWREWPVQYGVPSASQVFAKLAIAAGYEGILYRSSKTDKGDCLAIFPSAISSDRTFIELMDDTPETAINRRLDFSTCQSLDGMTEIFVPRQFRRST
ncbi:RES family NAD+ phosphorylase [Aquilutibacter rugosus]|uniref:RES family NAD+ phosphorylase n=1 Tax=Aquilutibacter rugosus TaxID=3115820 RepID=UPI002F40B3EB